MLSTRGMGRGRSWLGNLSVFGFGRGLVVQGGIALARVLQWTVTLAQIPSPFRGSCELVESPIDSLLLTKTPRTVTFTRSGPSCTLVEIN